MRLVYATGTPRHFEFAVAAAPTALPANAKVLAVCDGARVEGRLDGHTFDRMTDEEYYMLQALIADSQRAEAGRVRKGAHALRRALARLTRAFRR